MRKIYTIEFENENKNMVLVTDTVNKMYKSYQLAKTFTGDNTWILTVEFTRQEVKEFKKKISRNNLDTLVIFED